MPPKWHPNITDSAGTMTKTRQAVCDHPWDRRLTSEFRRMYCGACDVDFVEVSAGGSKENNLLRITCALENISGSFKLIAEAMIRNSR